MLQPTIPDLKIIPLALHRDNRGFFVERYHADKFAGLGLKEKFVQDNHSRSNPGVLRGLHAQFDPPQGKLVGVMRGRIWDVAVDARPKSPTFGQHHALELTDENGLLFWIPAGFLHGFCVLGDEPADVFYKVSGVYKPGGEIGIRYDDPELNIPWPIKNPIISERDKGLMSWVEYGKRI